jgi:hypothetical protein
MMTKEERRFSMCVNKVMSCCKREWRYFVDLPRVSKSRAQVEVKKREDESEGEVEQRRRDEEGSWQDVFLGHRSGDITGTVAAIWQKQMVLIQVYQAGRRVT